jgi:hypothetical protein
MSTVEAAPVPVTRWVYYARQDDRIKIGYTTGLKQRAVSLSPAKLLAAEPGSLALETQRHREFEDDWIEREWFRPSPALLAHVATAGPVPVPLPGPAPEERELRQQFCGKGLHEFTPENTGFAAGRRFCRECRRSYKRAWDDARKQVSS